MQRVTGEIEKAAGRGPRPSLAPNECARGDCTVPLQSGRLEGDSRVVTKKFYNSDLHLRAISQKIPNMGLTDGFAFGILEHMTTTQTTTATATATNFRKNSDEVGQVWIGDGTISETEALAIAATAIPNEWEVRSAEYHGISWVILASHKDAK